MVNERKIEDKASVNTSPGVWNSVFAHAKNVNCNCEIFALILLQVPIIV